MRLSTLTVSLAWSFHAAVEACTSDLDCSLNGICDTDTAECTCDGGWIGSECGILDLQPAQKDAGYNQSGITTAGDWGAYGNSSWCGSMVQDRDDATTFHLFTSVFAHGCGLGYWRPMSYVMRAESKTGPQGPYQYVQTVTDNFRHNPYVFWSEADQKYLLWTIGAELDDAHQPTTCTSVTNLTWTNNVSVSAADYIRGPWSPFQVLINGTNPAPWPLWTEDNQTSAIMLGVEDNTLYAADTYNGTYDLVKTQTSWNTSDYSPFWTEDPMIWRDKRGNWHSLNHWMIDIVEEGQKFPRTGVHLYAESLTGQWYFTQYAAFNSTVVWEDGTVTEFSRRERPKLFFSTDGELTPLYLTTGVTDQGTSSRSRTLIQPIGQKWKDFEADLGF